MTPYGRMFLSLCLVQCALLQIHSLNAFWRAGHGSPFTGEQSSQFGEDSEERIRFLPETEALLESAVQSFENIVSTYRDRVERWLAQLDKELWEVNHATALTAWQLSTDLGSESTERAQKLGQWRTAWRNAWCSKAEDIRKEWLEPQALRQIYLLCRGPKYTPHQARELSSILGNLQEIYATARVCRQNVCYRGEPDLDRLMQTSRDPAELLWAWQEWRRAVGPPSRLIYPALVTVQNIGAKNNGYGDIGECWREELEIPNLESVIEKLYEEVRPLYKLLHAVVRHKLADVYGEQEVNRNGPIPAHLLGNMWAQNWESLLDLFVPNSNCNLTAALQAKQYTTKAMVKRAEDFFVSLGLPPMTATFWQKSQLEASKDGRNSSCHGSAANMFKDDDFRMLVCAKVSEEDFYVIHHEMGHIQYYMAYHNQPVIFQDGANSAFQEAVGDAIMYGVMVPQHLERLGLINSSMPSPEFDTTFLLHQALAKIPQVPFGLLVDKWRWHVFSGDIPQQDYNMQWWKLRYHYQGVAPPVPRSPDDFDPAAKFHITDNTPYVRYFLSSILQVQIFKALCEAATMAEPGELPMPLHRCDLYGSKEAGDKLRQMMSLGSSCSWPDALQLLTGTREFSAQPLLEYYRPLYKWLEQEVQDHKIPVGWK